MNFLRQGSRKLSYIQIYIDGHTDSLKQMPQKMLPCRFAVGKNSQLVVGKITVTHWHGNKLCVKSQQVTQSYVSYGRLHARYW